MIRYYYTKLKLFMYTWRATRLDRKRVHTESKIRALQTVIAAGFTNEKEFTNFNKKLVENRRRHLDPHREKELDQLRNKHFDQWKPKKRFKDSKDRQSQQEGQQRSNFVRVLKNRPLVKNPQDSQPDVIPTPQQKG